MKANGLKDGKTKDGEEKSVENGVPEEEKKESKRELGKIEIKFDIIVLSNMQCLTFCCVWGSMLVYK